MIQCVDLLSTREQASLILLSALVIWGMFHRKVREGLPQLILTFLNRSILLSLFLLFMYILLEVWIGYRIGWWNNKLAKETVIWSVVSGSVLLFKGATKANKDPNFFRNAVYATILPTVFITFFINLTSFNLIVEIVLQLIVAVLVVVSIYTHAHDERKYEPVRKYSDRILTLIVFFWLVYTACYLFETWAQIDRYQLLWEFILPIWLTIGLLPFLFTLSLYVAYEFPFRLINDETNVCRIRWKARLALFIKMHVKPRDLVKFRVYWVEKLVNSSKFLEACSVVGEFKGSISEEARLIQEEKERLQNYAGVEGTDSEGRRLDRREFKETVKALHWLATCHMGHYRNRNRYDRNLLRLFDDDFTKQGLARPSGIVMKVSRDGQRWFAYRETVSGWYFAIGAAGPPPNQWEFDGSKPPRGFPGKDPSWGDGPFDSTVNKNWG